MLRLEKNNGSASKPIACIIDSEDVPAPNISTLNSSTPQKQNENVIVRVSKELIFFVIFYTTKLNLRNADCWKHSYVAFIKPIGVKFKIGKLHLCWLWFSRAKNNNWEMTHSLNQTKNHWQKIQNWKITPQSNNAHVASNSKLEIDAYINCNYWVWLFNTDNYASGWGEAISSKNINKNTGIFGLFGYYFQ